MSAKNSRNLRDDEVMTSLEVPLADPVGSPKQRIGKTSCYWEFDTVSEPGQRSIRSCLEEFWGDVNRYAGSIRFHKLSSLAGITGE